MTLWLFVKQDEEVIPEVSTVMAERPDIQF